MKKTPRWKKVLRVVFYVLLIISTLLSLLLFTARSVFLSPVTLTSLVTSREYDNTIYSTAIAQVEAKQNLFPIDIEILKEAIDDRALKIESRKYLRSLADHIVIGTAIKFSDFQCEELHDTIEAELNKIALANNATVKDGAVDKIYTSICEIINNEINLQPSDRMEKLPSISKFVNYFLLAYAFLLIAAVSVFLIWKLYKGRVFRFIYKACGAIWLGSAVVFIPIMVLNIFNLLAKLGLVTSPLSILINSAYSALISTLLTLSAIVFALSSIGLMFSIYMLCRGTKIKKTRHHHRYGYGRRKKHSSASSEKKKREKDIAETSGVDTKSNFIDIEEELKRVNK